MLCPARRERALSSSKIISACKFQRPWLGIRRGVSTRALPAPAFLASMESSFLEVGLFQDTKSSADRLCHPYWAFSCNVLVLWQHKEVAAFILDLQSRDVMCLLESSFICKEKASDALKPSTWTNICFWHLHQDPQEGLMEFPIPCWVFCFSRPSLQTVDVEPNYLARRWSESTILQVLNQDLQPGNAAQTPFSPVPFATLLQVIGSHWKDLPLSGKPLSSIPEEFSASKHIFSFAPKENCGNDPEKCEKTQQS